MERKDLNPGHLMVLGNPSARIPVCAGLRAEGWTKSNWYYRPAEAFRSVSAHATQVKYKLEGICLLKQNLGEMNVLSKGMSLKWAIFKN